MSWTWDFCGSRRGVYRWQCGEYALKYDPRRRPKWELRWRDTLLHSGADGQALKAHAVAHAGTVAAGAPADVLANAALALPPLASPPRRRGRPRKAATAVTLRVAAEPANHEEHEEHEAKLWAAWNADRSSIAARNRLVERYLPLAKSVAQRQAKKAYWYITGEELLGAAVEGLMQALHKFDPARGVRFSTYALQRVRGAIGDYLRVIDPRSRTARSQGKERRRQADALAQRLHARPTDADLADHFGAATAKRPTICLALEDLRSHEQYDEGAYREPAAPHCDPSAHQQQADAWRLITRFLSHSDQRILQGYYVEERSMREIGEELGLSESRISQRLKRLLEMLRAQRNLREAI